MVQVGVEEEVGGQQAHHQIKPAQQQDEDGDGREPGEGKQERIRYSNTCRRSDREHHYARQYPRARSPATNAGEFSCGHHDISRSAVIALD